uniref:ApeA N-terminal domain 1-containing protein n=1 Tax=Agathobacter sp. TaxID=2021311 RepID=UPI0040563F27
MGNRKADERRYIGRFTILQEEMDGEIIYNKKSGYIFLDLAKPLDEQTFMGKSYANIAVITGHINTGTVVTLFNNKCINNHTQVGQTQRIAFSCEYLIWSKEKKALKGDELRDAIFVLNRLLEYHICLILGVDIEEKVRESLSSHHSWKQLEKAQLSELKVNTNREVERL